MSGRRVRVRGKHNYAPPVQVTTADRCVWLEYGSAACKGEMRVFLVFLGFFFFC
jgi:hypothetical protein